MMSIQSGGTEGGGGEGSYKYILCLLLDSDPINSGATELRFRTLGWKSLFAFLACSISIGFPDLADMLREL